MLNLLMHLDIVSLLSTFHFTENPLKMIVQGLPVHNSHFISKKKNSK